MNITGFHTYDTSLCDHTLSTPEATPSYSVMLHLLALTRMNRWVCKDSFREFLVRLFLILDQEVETILERFLEDQVLLEGDVAGKEFRWTLEDLLSFTGFSRGHLDFHIWGTLEEFIHEYRVITYDVWMEEEEDEDGEPSLGNFSEDWLIMTMALNYGMYDIQHLSLKFKPDLLDAKKTEILGIERYVDFLLTRVPVDFFPNYQSEISRKLKRYSYSFTGNNTLNVDIVGMLYPVRILKIMRKSIGSKHSDYRRYMEQIDQDKEDPEVPAYFLDVMKFGLGVKYGLIQLSEHPENFHDCFDPRYEGGKLSSNLVKPGISTKVLFRKYKIEEWLYLIP